MVIDREIDRVIVRKQTKPKFEVGQTVEMNSLISPYNSDLVGTKSKIRRRFWVNGTKGSPAGWVYELEARKEYLTDKPRHTCYEWLIDPC